MNNSPFGSKEFSSLVEKNCTVSVFMYNFLKFPYSPNYFRNRVFSGSVLLSVKFICLLNVHIFLMSVMVLLIKMFSGT